MAAVEGEHVKTPSQEFGGMYVIMYARISQLHAIENKKLTWWRRGESNPRPKRLTVKSLHAYLVRSLLLPAALRNGQQRTVSQPLPCEGLSPGIPRRLIPSHPANRRLTSLMQA